LRNKEGGVGGVGGGGEGEEGAREGSREGRREGGVRGETCSVCKGIPLSQETAPPRTLQ